MRWIASMFRKPIIQAIIFSIVFLIIVYAISRLGLKVEAIHIVIALVPFIILLVVSGKLKTFKGPGGLELTLRDEVQRIVAPEFEESPLELKPELIMDKSTVGQLKNLISRGLPTTLSFQLKKKEIL